jgi:hypothetical protein
MSSEGTQRSISESRILTLNVYTEVSRLTEKISYSKGMVVQLSGIIFNPNHITHSLIHCDQGPVTLLISPLYPAIVKNSLILGRRISSNFLNTVGKLSPFCCNNLLNRTVSSNAIDLPCPIFGDIAKIKLIQQGSYHAQHHQ